jgi:hypothetical protein
MLDESSHYFHIARLEILTAVLLMIQVFWDAISNGKQSPSL